MNLDQPRCRCVCSTEDNKIIDWKQNGIVSGEFVGWDCNQCGHRTILKEYYVEN